MHIYIPTRGRADRLASSTAALIPESERSRVTLVTHPSEVQAYSDAADRELPGVSVVTLGDYRYIGEKRGMIGRHAAESGESKFFMLDDDLDFLIRRGDDTWRLRPCEPEEVSELFEVVDYFLDYYVQVSVSPREGNNRLGIAGKRELFFECFRAMRMVAYQTEAFNSCEHGRIPVMEDMDVTLQLLRRHHKNAVLGYWANGQKMTNSPGGCSIWRTRELHNAAARRLAELHSGLVAVRQKINKTDREGLGTRDEVTVQWKRAYQYG